VLVLGLEIENALALALQVLAVVSLAEDRGAEVGARLEGSEDAEGVDVVRLGDDDPSYG